MNKRQAMKAALWTLSKRYRRPDYNRNFDAERMLLKRGWSWQNLTWKHKPMKLESRASRSTRKGGPRK